MPISFKRLCQVAAVNEPFVKMSAICSFVLTYRSEIELSTRTLSKSQSRSTLCVRWTWRILGERPLMHILMTASLSSNIVKLHVPFDPGMLVGT